jgi:hypothetical protein
VLLILLGIVYVSANFVLKKVAVRVVEELKPKLEKKGILIENFDYSSVRLNSYNSIAITQIDLDFYLTKQCMGKNHFMLTLTRAPSPCVLPTSAILPCFYFEGFLGVYRAG